MVGTGVVMAAKMVTDTAALLCANATTSAALQFWQYVMYCKTYYCATEQNLCACNLI